MTHGRVWPAVGCLSGKLYVAGGIGPSKGRLAVSEVYDIGAGQWSDGAMADLPHAWWGSADFVWDDKLYLVGGRYGSRTLAASIVYDPYTDAWSYGPSTETPRYRLDGDVGWEAGLALGGWEPTWIAHEAADQLPRCPQCVHIEDIDLRSFDLFGLNVIPAVVPVYDDAGQPVSGVRVGAQWTLPDGSHQDRQSTTRNQGTAWFIYLSFQDGLYEICVTDVTGEGYFYAASQNIETCQAEQVP
jgi:hypothetical protein